MDWLYHLAGMVLQLDKHLALLVAQYGLWIYAVLFAVIFSETGLVVAPFLPGDSLLFIAGSVAALGGMNIHLLVVLLFIAATLGNLTNYEIGRWFGTRVIRRPKAAWLRPSQIDKTHLFFETWGSVAVIVARFVPFLRTYVPFVAGIGAMHRPKYIAYTLVGAALWVGSLCYTGYLFGNLPWVKANLGLLVIGIIALSLLPIAVGMLRTRFGRRKPS
ncbi:MAG: DedA family protein [Rhodocyclaceae bacterium]|jgi:membrane-associated protein|nr:DedA family protein [Rhodocyclaceae bacterium]MCE2724318.1 DedA family protein [Betaproteobacteria bacterium]MCA3023483.1 DedA family protein [Rhodocyclaceae bacterium]MCA3028621.1 DedA family protein [Rhodocyclaceae bacterium]MCA3052995.1 DedA family protein [Rhodocyclaceae bacterium]